MESSVSPKDEIWFLRVRHHISDGFYIHGFRHCRRIRNRKGSWTMRSFPPLPGLPLHHRPSSMQSDQSCTNVDWINLALEWVRLLFPSNVRINIRVPHQRVGDGRISWPAVRMSASQERLCFSELVDCLLVARMRARRPYLSVYS